MTIDVIISIDQNIHDPLTMGQTSVVTDIFNISANVINNGGRVLVQQQYENANPDTLAIFTKLDELASWRERLNQVQLNLGRENI